jgi:xanthine/uracil permease
MLGLNAGGGSIDLKSALVSLLVVTIVVVINLKARGFLQSIAILIGIAAGWVIAVLVGVPSGELIRSDALITLPELFAWGTPTFDPGVVFVSVLTGLLVLSNLVASILAMERVLDLELPRKSYNRGVAFTGFADILAGLGATVGFVPYSAGAGMVALTRVAARLPFVIFAVALVVLGLLPQVGAFLASIPEPVGYSVLLASFCQMLGFGLKDYARLEFNSRDYFVVGLPVLFGTGVMNLPAGSFEGIPVFAQYILGNGFVVGMLLCMLLEHVLLPKKYFS